MASLARLWEAFYPQAARERDVLLGGDHLDDPASAVPGAWELVVRAGLERPAATEISIARHQVVHSPSDVLALEDSHARRAAMDSSSVWELILRRKLGASSRQAVLRPMEKLPAAQLPEVASPEVSSPEVSPLAEPAEEPVLALLEQLQEAARAALEVQQRAQPPVLLEPEAQQRALQALQQSPQVQALAQVSAPEAQAEQAQPPQEAAWLQQEREERQQRAVAAEELRRQASDALP